MRRSQVKRVSVSQIRALESARSYASSLTCVCPGFVPKIVNNKIEQRLGCLFRRIGEPHVSNL